MLVTLLLCLFLKCLLMLPIKQGAEAFKMGVKNYKEWAAGKNSNPYSPNTARHKDWELGYNRAYFDNLEKVKSLEGKLRKTS